MRPTRLLSFLAALTLTAACAPRFAAVPEIPLPPVIEMRSVAPPELPPEPIEMSIRPTTQTPFPDGVNPDGFGMRVEYNDHVDFYLDLFTGRARNNFEQWLQRQGRFESMIAERLREHDMPAELLYLPLIESGYSTIAVSSAQAVGLWQFMAATGRGEGLEVSDMLDERRDPVRSTDAALQHLRRLYTRYGSWYLALAAYNAGSGRIDRILRDHADGATGHDSLFWAVRHALPTETRNYVPQFLAASIIGTHRPAFGFSDVVPQPALSFDVATIPDATELAVVAEVAGVPLTVVRDLNAHFISGITPPGRSVEVRLPAGTGEKFRVAYAALPPGERVRTRHHVVARGETLSGIAARYGSTVAILQRTNQIERANQIRVGQRIIVPSSATAANVVAAQAAPASPTVAPAPAPAATATASRAPTSVVANSGNPGTTGMAAREYTVRTGDNLSRIARDHGISLNELLTLNNLRADAVIRPGQRMRTSAGVVYVVRAGDTLSTIAQRHGVSTNDLKSWNSLKGDIIRPGDQLEVRTP
jgi:membrane-bound lytic murein transglycosylase D